MKAPARSRLGEDHAPARAPAGSSQRSSSSNVCSASSDLQPREPREAVAAEHRFVQAGRAVGRRQAARRRGARPIRSGKPSSVDAIFEKSTW